MDGSSLLFGAVGAISGVKNPILVAQRLVLALADVTVLTLVLPLANAAALPEGLVARRLVLA